MTLRPRIESYVEQCTDDEADFWTLFGHINGQGVEAIGDFSSREAARRSFVASPVWHRQRWQVATGCG